MEPVHPVVDALSQDRYKQQFYKTTLCRYFLEGSCKKGRQCSHAHAEFELHEKPVLSKTRMCKQALRNGTCDEPDCSFAHSIEEIISANSFFRTKMCDFYRKGGCKLGDKCRYAHSTEELNDQPSLVPESTKPSSPIVQPSATAGGMAPTEKSLSQFTRPHTKTPMVDYNDSPDTGYALRKKTSMGSTSTMAASSYASFGSFANYQQARTLPPNVVQPVVFLYPNGSYAYGAAAPGMYPGYYCD